MSIPTLLVFKNGRQEERVSGLIDGDELEDLIKGVK
jgi:thiol:disulfide interchange protein